MIRHRLPIGIQDFETIRSEDFYYVDKTPLIRRLVEDGRHYFLSRPRRFGKSLLVDTAEKTKDALETALTQIRSRGYAEKYRDRKEPIYLVAIACGRDIRNVLDIRVESAVLP
ncbi:MAG: AAA family ATPase [Aestuariivita sp.]|nr:AAA family ATPase [Aestuariivita sp.]